MPTRPFKLLGSTINVKDVFTEASASRFGFLKESAIKEKTSV